MNLEAISLLRFMPAAAADMGDVTREEMRQADQGRWSARLGCKDDLRAGLPLLAEDLEPTEEGRPSELAGHDVVVPLSEAAPTPEESVITLSFASD